MKRYFTTVSLKFVFALVNSIFIFSNSVNATVIFVDNDASGAQDGTSWADAYKNLQNALSVVNPGDSIFIAEGKYFPSTTNDRTETFNIPEGANIFGGFPKMGAPFSNRDVIRFKTILSGDIGTPFDNTDNSYHVIRLNDVGNALIEGVVIEDGNADVSAGNQYGGAVHIQCNASSMMPTFRNVIFQFNEAYSGGGAVNIYNASTASTCNPNFENCVFLGNRSDFGGAIFYNCPGGPSANVSPSFKHCTFLQNHADVSGSSEGGVSYGVSSNANCNAIFNNSIMWGNSSNGTIPMCAVVNSAAVTVSSSITQSVISGGTVVDPLFIDETNGDWHLQPCSPAIDAGMTSALITDIYNHGRVSLPDLGAQEFVGELYVTNLEDAGPGTLRNMINLANACSLAAVIDIVIEVEGQINLQSQLPAIQKDILIEGIPEMKNTLYRANIGLNYRIFRVDPGASLHLMDLVLANGKDAYGGAIYMTGDELTLDFCRIVDCESTIDGGGIYADYGIVDMIGTEIKDCYASNSGGALAFNAANTDTIYADSCWIHGNVCNTGFGAGLYFANATANIRNTTIDHNSNAGQKGGGIYSKDNFINLENTTISINFSESDGGGILLDNTSSSGFISKNITVFGNTSNGDGGGIYNKNDFVMTFTNSVLSGNTPNDYVESIAGTNFINFSHCDDGTLSGASSGFSKLGALTQVNNSKIPTHPVLCGSPLIDGADDLQAPLYDQSGQSRSGSSSDIGAMEYIGDDPALVADFEAVTNSSDAYQIDFTNTTEDAFTYYWDFGDTQTSTVESPSHIYGATGTYEVMLVVQNDCVTDTVYKSIIVADTSAVFSRTFSTGADDELYDVVQTQDGGYVMVGKTTGFGTGYAKTNTAGDNLSMSKVDENGNTEWTKAYGGDLEDIATGVVENSDGSLVMVGNTSSYSEDGNTDIFIIKTDASGNVTWFKTLGDAGDEYANTIVIDTVNGGYVIGGSTNSTGSGGTDAYVAKIDGSGNFVWANAYGGTGEDAINDGKIDGSGNFIWAGSTSSYGAGGTDGMSMKIDGSGNFVWANAYGGTGDETINDGKIDGSGNFVWAGSTSSYGAGGTDGMSMKIDGSGNFVWANAYGGTGDESFDAGKIDGSGNFVWAGTTSSYGTGGDDGMSMKIDGSGNFVWANAYGGTSDEKVAGVGGDDSEVMLFGSSTSFSSGNEEVFVQKTDTNGNTSCNKTSNSVTFTNIPNSSMTTTTLNTTQWVTTSISGVSKVEDITELNTSSTVATDSTICVTPAPLPVEGLLFTGEITENNEVSLYWSTNQETNNAGFEIYRSVDNQKFEKIGFVEGKNTISGASYTMQDQNVPNAILKYQLIQKDFDGNESYSNVLVLDNSKLGDFTVTVYPNPTKESFTMRVSGVDGEADLVMQLTDIAGKTILNVSGNKEMLQQQLSVVSSNLKAGIYFLKVKNNEKQTVEKLIKN